MKMINKTKPDELADEPMKSGKSADKLMTESGGLTELFLRLVDGQ